MTDVPRDQTGEPIPARPSAARLPEFEFGPEQERVIADLATRMRFVGGFLTVTGALELLLVFSGAPWSSAPLLGILVQGAISVAIGIWTLRAGTSLWLVEETHGRDVTHLMRAFANLRSLYRFEYWLCLAGLALAVLVLVFGIWTPTAR